MSRDDWPKRPLEDIARLETEATNDIVNDALAEVGVSLRRYPLAERGGARTPMKLLVESGFVFDDPKSARMAARQVVTAGTSWCDHPEFKNVDEIGPRVMEEDIMAKMQLTLPPWKGALAFIDDQLRDWDMAKMVAKTSTVKRALAQARS